MWGLDPRGLARLQRCLSVCVAAVHCPNPRLGLLRSCASDSSAALKEGAGRVLCILRCLRPWGHSFPPQTRDAFKPHDEVNMMISHLGGASDANAASPE